ncbi:MAG: tol-pal system protein YbgF [Actinomycetota bacterium]|nr:tol-pal system protein YbgF [Actinomycetota bacterium]
MRLALPALLAIALLPLFAGCANQDDIKADLNDLKSQTYSLSADVASMKAEMAKQKQDNAGRDSTIQSIRDSQANLLDQINSTQKEVRDIRGRFDEEQKLLSEQSGSSVGLSQRLDKVKREQEGLVARLANAESAIALLQKKAAATPVQDYEEATNLFNQGKYDEARSAFKAFIGKYHSDPLAGNAQFWIGETYFKQKDYDSAILAYENVIKKYPSGAKMPAALLKQGMAFQLIKDKRAAAAVFKQLVKKYPDTEEAAAAKTKLREMKVK